MNAPLDPDLRQALEQASLEDRWTRERGRVYLSGTQALVRLLMLQRQRDLAAGRNTAGVRPGYPASPVGGADMTTSRARAHLSRQHARFQPGVNEDLAATAVW